MLLPRELDDQVVDQLVVAAASSCSALGVLPIQCYSDWMCSAWMSGFGLKSSLRNGRSSGRSQRIGAAVRLVERVFAECVVRRRRRDRAMRRYCRADRTGRRLRVEELLELDVRELADFAPRCSRRRASRGSARGSGP